MDAPELHPTENARQSLLFAVSEKFSAVFRPLGFDRPEAAAALIFGFFAKENIVGVLGIMTQAPLRTLLTPPAALAFIAFSAFYTPCIFLLTAVGRKSGIREAILLFLRTFALAYALSFVLHSFFQLPAANCLI